jgi:hypothetical protein
MPFQTLLTTIFCNLSEPFIKDVRGQPKPSMKSMINHIYLYIFQFTTVNYTHLVL